MKTLHLSDIHADEKDFEECQKCLNFIVETAEKEEPDLIVMSGDTFNSQDVRLDTKAVKMVFDVFSRLCNVAPVSVVIGTPSHDGNAAEVLKHIRGRYPVRVSDYPEQFYLDQHGCFNDLSPNHDFTVFPGPVALITAIPTPTKEHFKTQSGIAESDKEISEAITHVLTGFGMNATPDIPHIVNAHFQVAGAYISETQVLTGVDIEVSKDQLSLLKANVVCMGHIHKAQKIGENIFYAGSPYAKTWGETDEKGFYIHNIDGVNNYIGSDFIPTPTTKLVKIDLDFTNNDPDDQNNIFYDSSEGDCLNGCAVKVTIALFRDDRNKFKKPYIENFYLSSGAKSVIVDFIQIPRENIRSANFLKLETLPEKLVEQARIKEEKIPDTVLEKAELLESFTAEKILSGL